MSAFDTRAWFDLYAEWTPRTVDYGDTTLLDSYQASVKEHADRVAINFFGKTQTYAELDRQVRRAAAGLKAFGVRPGDRVAILLPNCPQHVAAFYAVLLLGATVVEHNPLYTAHELEHPFHDHGARIAIAWDKAAPTLEKLRGTTSLETIVSVNMIEAMPTPQRLALQLPIPALRKTRDKLSGEAPNTVPWELLIGNAIGGNGANLTAPECVTTDSIALILYTSGTTGTPKGAQLSHGNLSANLEQAIAWVPGLGDSHEKFLSALPMFHAYGLTTGVLLAVRCGSEMNLLPAPDLKLIMKIMRKNTPSFLPGVPTLYEKIAEAAESSGLDITGVRNSFSGASTLPVAIVERWENLTGGRLVEGYGLTECSPILVGNPMDGGRRPGYIGLPFPDTLIRIANPDNLDETQPDGVAGEVLAKGPQVFQGYLNQPEATAESFHDGWYRTGDVGIMEPDGFIKLVARIKEVIITGGFNVYPVEVEDVLLTHPDVAGCAVVGMPRGDGSENVVAAITLAEGAVMDPDGLKAHCRELLTRYKVPRTFYHFEHLPQDQMGKIRRREVRDQLIERYGAS
ncbi:long-chain fatty acid--CoA ligase [Corynebacterium hindlerae]|uniref:Long-chain fatty acid--CoA ligase n=1 Tax=Corynebacterium hindlerae TaxID=699041 RepID=A0A7G5FI06_9CORY|nr:long-chain-fatty-acid--CoA ligase [Corynebacterium hindlerae]QMV86247.1 long-chain fatty acid--CoA ligase [Corynebacterium hindlerae]QTH60126.1 long-chain fatty acid--CoA ligase [Corynebacterium hindlerae]